jgi:hypothetical protein
MSKKLILFLILGILVLLFLGIKLISLKEVSEITGVDACQVDSDCMVFGSDGDCNCGCYHKNYDWKKEGDCFCAAPISCRCLQGKCQPILGGEMTLEEAIIVAKNSECGDRLKNNSFYNENSQTWWIDLDISKEGCNPACVVNVNTGLAEINWRCTGLMAD